MKHLIETIRESLLSGKNKDELKRLSSDDYYEDPPMTSAQAMRKLDKTGRVYWEAKEKMKDWHEGRRKENIKACKPEKLIMFWDICAANKYDDQLDELELEANRRGWTFKKIKRN